MKFARLLLSSGIAFGLSVVYIQTAKADGPCAFPTYVMLNDYCMGLTGTPLEGCAVGMDDTCTTVGAHTCFRCASGYTGHY